MNKFWGRKRCPHCGEMITIDYLPRLQHFKECAPRKTAQPVEERRLPPEQEHIKTNLWTGH